MPPVPDEQSQSGERAASTDKSIGTTDSRTGTLSSSDGRFIHGGPAEAWRLDLAALATLRISLASQSFDALLIVTDLSMNVVAADDDFGGEGSALLVHTFAAGSYLIWAASVDPNGTGEYQLSTEPAIIASRTTPVGSIAVGQVVTGSLATGESGRFGLSCIDHWILQLAIARTVRIDLMSAEFDPVLIVTDRNGVELAFDVGGGEGAKARLTHAFAAGEYRIVVRSYWLGETGAYTLAVQP